VTAKLRGNAAHRIRLGAIWAVLGLVFGLLLAAAAPLALGDHSYTVRSGSMSPAIDTGDIVLTEGISPLDARVGDIVTFKDPDGTGRLISHRVRQVHAAGGELRFVTKGDANNTTEHWAVASDGRIGRVVYRLPRLGYALFWADTPAGRIGLISMPALLLCVFGLLRIWRPRPGEAR
jgi:signal peptidase